MTVDLDYKAANQIKNRQIDKELMPLFGVDSLPGESYQEFKKRHKKHFTAFEIMPGESIQDFKKRITSRTIGISEDKKKFKLNTEAWRLPRKN